MKAIRVQEFGGPEVLRYEDVPDPVPGPGEVVIAVRAIGVNPVEAYVRTGTYAMKPDLPYTPGSDVAGVVEAVGSGVTAFKAGDRVYTARTLSGAYAEKTLADASVGTYPLPDNISFAQGAALGVPYGTAYRALIQRAHAVAGETLLVHGATGGVGIAAVQIAHALGLRVWGTAGTDAGAEVVRQNGAQEVFNHHEDDYLDRAKAATPDGKGFAVILEMLANVNLGRDLSALAVGGRVVVIGSRGPVEINPRDMMGRDAAILGMTLFNATPPNLTTIHAALFAGLQNGSLRPLIAQEIPLSEAARAQIAVMDDKGHAPGKIVLVP